MVELSAVGRRIAAQSIAIKKYLPLKTCFQSAISQCQQSTIVPTSFRSTQTCGGRSSAVQVRMKVVVVGAYGARAKRAYVERMGER